MFSEKRIEVARERHLATHGGMVDPGIFSWCTNDFSGLEKLDQWNDVASTAFTPLAISALGEKFDARLRLVNAGAARIATVESHASHVDHGKPQISAGTTDAYYMLHIQNRGTSVHRQGGRMTTIGPGDLAFVDATRPYDVVFDDEASFLVCRLTASALTSRFINADDFVAKRFSADSAGTRIVRNCIEALWHESLARELVADSLIEELIAENLRFAAHDFAQRDAREEKAKRFGQAVRIVEQRLAEADLEVGALADEMGISLRSLQKVFAANGTTPSELIRTLRVREARKLLQAGSRSVTNIAFDVGFSDINQFCRAFRRETGLTPSSYRRRYS